MPIVTISPRRQIVIPKEIRQALRVKPGQRFVFTVKDGRIRLSPVLTSEQPPETKP